MTTEIKSLKDQSRGHWPSIIPSISNVDAAIFDGRHGPCPKCGGKDRFRALDDFADSGAVLCNQCHNKNNGDGLSTIEWLTGKSFPEVLALVAEQLKVPHSNGNAIKAHRTKETREKSGYKTFREATNWLIEKKFGGKKYSKHWLYKSADGKVIAAQVRFDTDDGKQFSPLHVDQVAGRKSTGRVLIGAPPKPIPIYHLPEVIAANTVYICEGEKAADAATGIGLVATTSMNGARSPKNSDWSVLSGKDVVILPDNDGPGREYANEVAILIFESDPTASIKIVHLPSLPDGGDIVEWIEAHGQSPVASELIQEINSLADSSPPLSFLDVVGLDLPSVADEPASTRPVVGSKDVLGRLGSVIAEGADAFFRDVELLKALAAAAVEDPPLYAANRALLKKAGVGMRDLDKALRKMISDVCRDQARTMARDDSGGFYEDSGYLCREQQTADGVKSVQICNFVALIVEETTRDDGVEQSLVLGLNVTIKGRPSVRINIAATVFGEPGKWVIQSLGSDAIVWPGENRCLIPAIQALSTTKKRNRVFSHTGWRDLDGTWGFLHSGGAITSDGNRPDVSVLLSAPLDKVLFPDPPAGEDLIKSVQASLSIIDVASKAVTVPLLAACFRSVIGGTDFSIFVAGLTGVGKSEVVALIQQHFGAMFTSRNLPASWSSTDNWLEALAFLAKDMVLVIDDFIPTGTGMDVAKCHQKAERVLRAQGNSSGRGRMKVDGTLRPSKPPRGLVLSTGEDIPNGQSLRARTFIVETPPGDVNFSKLTICQDAGAKGLYAAAMSAFLKWASGRLTKLRERHAKRVAEIRLEVCQEGHARTGSLIAELVAAWETFLEFAYIAHAIDGEERQGLLDSGRASIIGVAHEQGGHHEESNPVDVFMRMISSAIASGAAHLANHVGESPADSPGRWGWRSKSIGTGLYQRDFHEPQGKRIGWLDDGQVYLEPASAFSVAQAVASSHGRTIPVSERTLWKRMKEHSPTMLSSWDESRTRNTVRKIFEGARRDVIHLADGILSVDDSDGPVDSDGTEIGTVGQLGREKTGYTHPENINEIEQLKF